MKRLISIIATIVLLLACLTVLPTTAATVVYTPPGPGSTNPALQPDGIMVPDVFGNTANWNLTPPLRKFKDTLAGLCTTDANGVIIGGKNNLGQCIPVAKATPFPYNGDPTGSDYYEIAVVEYREQMHSDLPPLSNPNAKANPATTGGTKLRGYVQLQTGTNNFLNQPHYLGPVIITQKNRPVRIKFVNLLPKESDSPFFLPVDRTVMGSGYGPEKLDPAGPACDPVTSPANRNPNCAMYTTNRAELHLHGGHSPWISDGTPHQWITPANEVTPYSKGVGVQYVPDMWYNGTTGALISACSGQTACGTPGATNNPGPGAQTFYYTNDQSARLMFYHDHSYGITRLNVYAGEAAGYIIQDSMETALVNSGVIPPAADTIPLVIQDKAFVDASTIGTLDPTWVWGTGNKTTRWVDANGTDITATCIDATCSNVLDARKKIVSTHVTGDLWWPHVYMPAENPADFGGVNAMGRWVYGMYFWPPTTGIKFPPVDNVYYDCDPLGGVCHRPWEPAKMPDIPNPSWGAEAFVDTPMINGTVYPTVTLQPKTYRFRILNAAHDRFFNLQLYEADATVDPNVANPMCATMGGCTTLSEVRMVPAINYPAFPLWDAAADQREGGVPDPATAGPPWIVIGNEGGFLPAPAVVPNQPISWVNDVTLFNAGNVNDGTVILGPAERADVILDFSAYAGKTLILYNDAPAAYPAYVAQNDYYTGAPDQSATGGHPGTKAGIGPNTRTLMQIKIAAGTPAAPFNLNKLNDEFNAATSTVGGVFKQSQEPPIIGQSAYDSALNYTFPSVAPYWGVAGIADQKMSFVTLNKEYSWSPEVVSLYPLEPKALHDEMGAVWDEYGRMSAKLGVELPNTSNINQIFVMQNYVDPPTEIVQDGKVQIWKMTHNGVDTHPIHFHLFDVQVINRVGWDGFIRAPWPYELGWKETVKVSPLEDTIVALRPKAPPVPFSLPASTRAKNPAYPDVGGITDGFMSLDPLTGQPLVPPLTNDGQYNYGAEYVWHCHILSHEEQDMMRAIVLRHNEGAPAAPSGLQVTAAVQKNTLTWTDNSYAKVTTTLNNPQALHEGGGQLNIVDRFDIERCTGAGCSNYQKIAEISMIASSTPTYTDTQIAPNTVYRYRVTGRYRYSADGTKTWITGSTAPATTPDVTSATWSPATGLVVDVTTPLAPVTRLCGPTSSASTAPAPYTCASSFEGPARFIALGSGSTSLYQYRFTLTDKGTNTTTLVQDYSTTRYWTLPAVTTAGTYNYRMKVDVRTDPSSTNPDISSIVDFTLLPTLDTTPPVTTAIPAAGAFLNPVQVYLQANETGSVIKYTIDGSDPVTSATAAVYSAPISISATTTLKYFATDPAGNPETVQTGLYELRPANLNATVTINGGAAFTKTTAVTIALTATGATQMSFSNDNATYSAEQPFGASKSWTLSPATPDGIRTVYVRLRDSNGILQAPIAVQITLDTIPPVTTPLPAPAIAISPVSVTLSADQANSVIRYTVDGSDPVTSATASTYAGPILVAATTAIKYFATDPAGNAETVKTSIYEIHTADLVVDTFLINGGATLTKDRNATLSISATDATGVVKMRFSNDGVTYSADENYAVTKANWPLSSGDGLKTVYVRFTDGAGILYEPVTAQITLDTTAPATSITPPSGTFINPFLAYISSNEPGSTIRYTLDGSDPKTSATAVLYTGPINIATTGSLKYFATDVAGNAGSVTTTDYTITQSTAFSLSINGGASLTKTTAVTLGITATGMAQMQFSNNGVNYSALEGIAATKAWTLDPGDGAKTVFVRFVDGTGMQFNPVVAQITLDTTPATTTVSPRSGTVSLTPYTVSLTASDGATGSGIASIRYTTDGSDPLTSATAATYTTPLAVGADSTLDLRFAATDLAGNVETPQSATFTATHPLDMVASVSIANAPITITQEVVLLLSATDVAGVPAMQFSNDGVSYTALEGYHTVKAWTLSSGVGLKTVFVKFKDGSGNLYGPFTAQIELAAKDGIMTNTSSLLSSALRALQAASGLYNATAQDLAHADVAPYVNGASKPDGKIDALDAYVILQRQVGSIIGF